KDLDSVKLFHPRQKLVGLTNFPATHCAISAENERVSLVKDKHGFLGICLLVRFPDVLLGSPHPHGQEVASFLEDYLFVEDRGDMAGHLTLSGSGWTVKQKSHCKIIIAAMLSHVIVVSLHLGEKRSEVGSGNIEALQAKVAVN